MSQSVLRRNLIVVVKATAKFQNVSECLSRWYLLNGWTFYYPCSGELRTQKLKSHLITQSLSILTLEPGVGQYIAIHAMLTAMDVFLANFYPFGPFTFIFSTNSPEFFLCWLWLTYGSCVGPQNKIGHPARCRFPCWAVSYTHLTLPTSRCV